MPTDTVYHQSIHLNYNLSFHLTDSGTCVIVKKNTQILFKSDYSEGYYKDTVISTAIQNLGLMLLLQEAYCDGTDYNLLVIKNDSIFIKNIAQVLGGDLCDTEPSVQPIYIIDNNQDGFPEYYINYSFENKKPIQLPCSFYVDSKTFLVK